MWCIFIHFAPIFTMYTHNSLLSAILISFHWFSQYSNKEWYKPSYSFPLCSMNVYFIKLSNFMTSILRKPIKQSRGSIFKEIYFLRSFSVFLRMVISLLNKFCIFFGTPISTISHPQNLSYGGLLFYLIHLLDFDKVHLE